ncbi:MAG TPA: DpnII family type II restriction endonuclease, partial [Methanocorpusculum sp.]|nr:DpnII family type II restriction endonuclease [Methanocorpusculum sp.]
LEFRRNEIYANGVKYDFTTSTGDNYAEFMRETGLFNLMQKHIVNNLYDYVLGVETGIDSNGRKNRGGHLMENLVEKHLHGFTYYKEMTTNEIERKFGLDMSALTNNGKVSKRFDFVVRGSNIIYGIECNFYTEAGSKLQETARSYKGIALESKDIPKFKFIWITDGIGWRAAKKVLLETAEVLEDIYNIEELENNILEEVLL